MSFQPIENEFNLTRNPNNTLQVCFKRPPHHGHGFWTENASETIIPSFVLQLAVLLSLNRIFLFISESYHIPRIVAHIFVSTFQSIQWSLVHEFSNLRKWLIMVGQCNKAKIKSIMINDTKNAIPAILEICVPRNFFYLFQ